MRTCRVQCLWIIAHGIWDVDSGCLMSVSNVRLDTGISDDTFAERYLTQ